MGQTNGTTSWPNGNVLDLTKQSEKRLLGGLLPWPDAIDEMVLGLRVEHFFNDAHQKVYAALLALLDEGKHVVLEAVADVLYRRKQIDDLGGYSYLAELWDSEPTGANVFYYADLVRGCALQRDLLRVG